MSTYTKRILWLIGIMIAVAGSILWIIQDRFFQEDILSIQEASEKVESLYAGSVESFESVGESYKMTLERDGKVYDVVVDATTGDISTLTFVAIIEEAGIYKTAKQIRTIVADKYKGEIQTIEVREKDNKVQYVVDVTLAQGAKTLILDAETGELFTENNKSLNIATNNDAKTNTEVDKTPAEDSEKATVTTSKPNSTNNSSSIKTSPIPSSSKNSASSSTQPKESNETTKPNNSNSGSATTKPAKSTQPSNAIISRVHAVEIARSQLKGKIDDVDYEKTADGGYYLIEIEGQQTEAVFQIHGVSGKVMSITREDYQNDDNDDDDHEENDD